MIMKWMWTVYNCRRSLGELRNAILRHKTTKFMSNPQRRLKRLKMPLRDIKYSKEASARRAAHGERLFRYISSVIVAVEMPQVRCNLLPS